MNQAAKGKTGVVTMGVCGSKSTCGKELREKGYKKDYLEILGKGVVPSEGIQIEQSGTSRMSGLG